MKYCVDCRWYKLSTTLNAECVNCHVTGPQTESPIFGMQDPRPIPCVYARSAQSRCIGQHGACLPDAQFFEPRVRWWQVALRLLFPPVGANK